MQVKFVIIAIMNSLIRKAVVRTGIFVSDFVLFLKNVFLFFRSEFKAIIAFTFLCTFGFMIVTWYINYAINAVFVHCSDISYVALGNADKVATSPAAWFCGIFFIFSSAFLTLFEVSGLVHCYSMSQVGRETNVASMVAAGFRTCRKTLKPVNWPVIVFLIILLPLAGGLTFSSGNYKAAIPSFIIQGIQADRFNNIIYRVVYFLLLFADLVYIFSVNIYVMQNVSFPSAMRRSRQLGRGYYLNTLLTIVLLTLVLNFLINSVSSIIPINIAELISFFERGLNITIKQMILGNYVYAIRRILKSLFAPAVNTAGLTVLFFSYIEEKNMLSTVDPNLFRNYHIDRKKTSLLYSALSAAIGVLTFGIVFHYSYLLDDIDHPVEVCAHRGDNVHAPENTLPAFELAVKENIEWVETDVQETKDGIVVLSHDYNLKRCTGHNVQISKATLEEIQRYEMGAWMPGNYDHGVTAPTLEALLELVRDSGMKIQIELKPTESDKHLEEEVIRLIHKYGLEERSMVISLHADRIERIKELDPGITTAVCVNVAWENVKDIPYSDNLSISDIGVTADLVKQMHDAGLKVFCWTVDSMDDVQYLVSCGVDVIGTNNPLAIEEALDVADYRGGLYRMLRLLLDNIGATER